MLDSDVNELHSRDKVNYVADQCAACVGAIGRVGWTGECGREVERVRYLLDASRRNAGRLWQYG